MKTSCILFLIAMLLAGCSRRPKLKYPEQSHIWPKHHVKVRLAIPKRLNQAVALKGKKQRRAFDAVVERTRQMMGRPELSDEDRKRLVEMLDLANGAVPLMRYVYGWCKGKQGIDFGSFATRCRDYAKTQPELQAWLESQAPRSGLPVAQVAEALLSEFDHHMLLRLRALRRGRPKEELVAKGQRDSKAVYHWRPAGKMGDVIPDIVLLYVAITRPDDQLVSDLTALQQNFQLEVDAWDAARILARLGKPELVKKALGRQYHARPKYRSDLERRQAVAYAFYRGVKRDRKAGAEMLEIMTSKARRDMRAPAHLAAAETYERMGSRGRAVSSYRKAYALAPKDPQAFRGMLKAAEMEAFRMDAAEAGLAHCEELIANAPNASSADEARLLMARICEKLKRPQDAVNVYVTLRDRYANTEFAASVMLLAMNVMYKAGEYDRVHGLAALNESLFEKHKKADRSALMMALADLGALEYDSARKGLRELLAKKPEPDIAARAQFLIGYSHLVTQEYAEACGEFDELVAKHPGTKWAKTASKQYLPKLRQFAKKDEREGNDE